MAFRLPTLTAKDHYAALGVSHYADRKEIRTAYHALALKFHPDKNAGDRSALTQFQEVQEAYEVLADPERKYEYDLTYKPASNVKGTRERDLEDDELNEDIWAAWGANFTGRKRAAGSASPSEPYFRAPASGLRSSSQPPHTPATERFGDKTFDVSHSHDQTAYATPPSSQRSGTTDAGGAAFYIASDSEKDADEDRPSSPSAGKHWTFFDYYDNDYNEKPLIQDLRDRAESAKVKWREACKAVDKAKVDVNYAGSPDEKESLQHVFDAKKGTRDSWQRLKWTRESNLKRHLSRAKELKQIRRQQDRQAKDGLKKRQVWLKEVERRRKVDSRAAEAARRFRTATRPRTMKTAKLKTGYVEVGSDDEWDGGDVWNP